MAWGLRLGGAGTCIILSQYRSRITYLQNLFKWILGVITRSLHIYIYIIIIIIILITIILIIIILIIMIIIIVIIVITIIIIHIYVHVLMYVCM